MTGRRGGVPARTVRRSALLVAAAVAASAAVAACSGGSNPAASTASRAASPAASPAAAGRPTPPPADASVANLLPGMPPLTDPTNVYAADRPGDLSPVARRPGR